MPVRAVKRRIPGLLEPAGWALLGASTGLALAKTPRVRHACTPEARDGVFRQRCGVDIYTQSSKQRLESTGSLVRIGGFEDELGKVVAWRYTLDSGRRLYLCHSVSA